jgi:hypothetical protein
MSWNRCDDCGRFIAYEEFGNGAIHKLITPLSACTWEEWETVCGKCVALGKKVEKGNEIK